MIDYKALFDFAPNPYLILDSNLVIVAVNKAYLDATMTNREMLIGKYLFEAFPANPEDLNANGVSNLQASLESVLNKHEADTMAVQRYDIPNRDDAAGGFEERFWCSVNSPIFGTNRRVELIIHNAQDVTQFVQSKITHRTETEVNQELKEHTDRLELKVYSSAQALQKANKALEKANKAKSMFLTSMSHELRTPLNAILGFAQLLQIDSPKQLAESQKNCVQQILKGGYYLLDLINDILDLSKIESGKTELSMENILIKPVLDETIELINASVNLERRISLHHNSSLEGDEQIHADITRIKQVIFNLLSNALKYNRKDGQVTLNCHQTNNESILISVIDTGPGIDKAKQHELFIPFKRLGAEMTNTEGSGIGLTISKKMTELMGGQIGFESELGKGSHFWIEFPIVKQLEAKISQVPPEPISQTAKMPSINGTLLYVEDNSANMRLMKMIVSAIEGLSFLSAPDAEMGIAIACQQQPDIIILDIHLPKMNGYEALQILKSKEETAHIPILALSAAASENELVKGEKAGFVKYLTKPIDILQLTEAIRCALQK